MAATLSTEECVGQDWQVAVWLATGDGRDVHDGGSPGDG
jgi:hypothetical protein